MKFKLETITPAIARGLLAKNNKNRNIRETHVDFLASEMAGGRYQETSEAIAIAPCGTIVNGQHRLLAVVQSGKTLAMWVARDVPLSTQDVIDIGARRTVADQLHLGGTSNASLMAAAARQIGILACYNRSVRLSVESTRSILREFQSEVDFCAAAMARFRPGRCGWVVGTLAFALHGEPKLKAFVEGVGSGENLTRGNPAKTLRDWLLNAYGSGKTIILKAKAEAVLNVAYNAANGSTVGAVRRGAQGVDWFAAKNKKFVAATREQLKQQLLVAEASAELAAA